MYFKQEGSHKYCEKVAEYSTFDPSCKTIVIRYVLAQFYTIDGDVPSEEPTLIEKGDWNFFYEPYERVA